MLKHLILPALALTLSLATHAQTKIGLALDYEHIQAPALQNLGSGSGMGGSVFFYAPLKHNLGLDVSFDLAGGHTTYQFYPFSPDPAWVPTLVSEKRSFFYTAIPVHLVYSHTFRQLRLFAGAGVALASVGMSVQSFHGFEMGGTCTTFSGSFTAGLELFQHVMLSGEFRPFNTVLNKTDRYQYTPYKVDNLLSVKLGYVLGTIHATKHSAGKKHPNT